MIPHHTFTFGLSLQSCLVSCGCCGSHILTLCLFNFPEKWKAASSLEQTCLRNASSLKIYPNISSANSLRLGLIFGLRAYNHKLLRRIRLNVTVEYGSFNSLAAVRVDFIGERLKSSETRWMFSSDIFGRPLSLYPILYLSPQISCARHEWKNATVDLFHI